MIARDVVLSAVAVLSGYLIGSVPFAQLLSRRRGVDLRVAGSGNVGAANALRTSGAAVAVAALCLDAAKGCAAVTLARSLSANVEGAVLGGLGSMLGHVYSPWLGFRGGKGVATGAGVFAVLAPLAVVIAAAVFALTVVTTRFISAGSLAGSVALVVAAVGTGSPGSVQAGTLAALVLIAVRHRGNLARLRAGTERPIGARW